MAIFHLSIQIISRGDNGRSAVAAAAYRAAEKIKNERDGEIHDYTRKGGVVYTEIMLPDNAPPEYADRSVLWNAVEKVEKHSKAQLAREIEFALPAELTREQNISLARRYVEKNFVGAGMCADVCLHDKGDGKPHAHVLLTMRPLKDDGTWDDKQRKVYILDDNGNKIYDRKKKTYKCDKVETTDWNDQSKAEEWRAAWADEVNAALQEHGINQRIDHRSYERQGVEIIPSIKMGSAASQMERRGIRTERGDINREIAVTNKEIRSLRARIYYVKNWLADANEKLKSPSLIDVIDELYQRDGVSHKTRFNNFVDVCNFLMRNKIGDLGQLEDKVDDMKADLKSVQDELRNVERRIDTLNKHIVQAVNYKQYRGYRKHYDRLRADYETAKNATGFGAERKAKKALDAVKKYYEARRAELDSFNEADKYLRGVLQSRFDPNKLPLRKWQNELAEKLEKRDTLSRKFASLKDETRNVEHIKRSIERMMGNDSSESVAPTGKAKSQSGKAQNEKPSILEKINRYSQMQQQSPPEQKPGKSHDMER